MSLRYKEDWHFPLWNKRVVDIKYRGWIYCQKNIHSNSSLLHYALFLYLGTAELWSSSGQSSASSFISCARSFVVSSVTDFKQLPLSAGLTLSRRKKSHGAISDGLEGCSSTVMCVLWPWLFHWGHTVGWCIVLMKDETIFPELWSRSSTFSSEVSRTCVCTDVG